MNYWSFFKERLIRPDPTLSIYTDINERDYYQIMIFCVLLERVIFQENLRVNQPRREILVYQQIHHPLVYK